MKKVFLLYGICLCLFACREQSGKEQQRITILQDSIKTTSAGEVEESREIIENVLRRPHFIGERHMVLVYTLQKDMQ